MKQWKKLSQQYVLRSPWLSLRKDKYKTPTEEIINDFYIVERPDFIVIVPQTKDGKFILAKQYRHGIEKSILNFPMGFIDKNESPQETARKELSEETGFSGGKLEYVGKLFLSPPFIKSIGHIFGVHGVSHVSQNEETDGIEVERVELVDTNKIETLIDKGELSDFVSVASYFLVKRRGRCK